MMSLGPTQNMRHGRIGQVLTPVDFSAAGWRPVAFAACLAERFVADHRVLHVDTSSPWQGATAGELLIETAPNGHHVEVEVTAAPTPAEGILRALEETSPALLVMATHGHTAFAETILGSTTEQVLRRWDGPVIATGPHYLSTPDLERIVVCVEPSLPLPGQLLADVKAWADYLSLPVIVFGVTSDTLRMERAREAERLHEAALALSSYGKPATWVTAGSGSVPGNIVELADAEPGTLIAVATQAATPSARLFLGSVAMAVCRRSTSPVLLRRVQPLPAIAVAHQPNPAPRGGAEVGPL